MSKEDGIRELPPRGSLWERTVWMIERGDIQRPDCPIDGRPGKLFNMQYTAPGLPPRLIFACSDGDLFDRSGRLLGPRSEEERELPNFGPPPWREGGQGRGKP